MNVNVSEYISCDVNECIIGFVVDSFLQLESTSITTQSIKLHRKAMKSNVQEKLSCVLTLLKRKL